jgi:methylated-DNA-[protein]-cysteine S-methyltransferase
MRYQLIDTFTGPFAIIEDDGGDLTTTWLTAEQQRRFATLKPDRSLQPELVMELKRYFNGEHVDFSDAPLPQASAFTRKCWKVCRAIPRGQTISYAELAKRAGSPGAARAAGQAMRNNPLPIITPCHRVVGSSGRLHGFGGSCDAQGSQLNIKAKLLAMEAQSPPPAKIRSRRRQLAFA